jgi:hypothetical protein
LKVHGDLHNGTQGLRLQYWGAQFHVHTTFGFQPTGSVSDFTLGKPEASLGRTIFICMVDSLITAARNTSPSVAAHRIQLQWEFRLILLAAVHRRARVHKAERVTHHLSRGAEQTGVHTKDRATILPLTGATGEGLARSTRSPGRQIRSSSTADTTTIHASHAPSMHLASGPTSDKQIANSAIQTTPSHHCLTRTA